MEAIPGFLFFFLSSFFSLFFFTDYESTWSLDRLTCGRVQVDSQLADFSNHANRDRQLVVAVRKMVSTYCSQGVVSPERYNQVDDNKVVIGVLDMHQFIILVRSCSFLDIRNNCKKFYCETCQFAKSHRNVYPENVNKIK